MGTTYGILRGAHWGITPLVAGWVPEPPAWQKGVFRSLKGGLKESKPVSSLNQQPERFSLPAKGL